MLCIPSSQRYVSKLHIIIVLEFSVISFSLLTSSCQITVEMMYIRMGVNVNEVYFIVTYLAIYLTLPCTYYYYIIQYVVLYEYSYILYILFILYVYSYINNILIQNTHIILNVESGEADEIIKRRMPEHPNCSGY